MQAIGLSPRLRGNQYNNPYSGDNQRSIPALAGEPYPGQPRIHRRTVYPRACGGTVSLIVGKVGGTGLSPRLRGNLPELIEETFGDGSIPALAGEPPARCAPGGPARVYPRACGGTLPLPGPSQQRPGLSPRLRGNRDCFESWVRSWRSIPALAGEPDQDQWNYRIRKGLSPRLRGNPCSCRPGPSSPGSIPALAGEPGAGESPFHSQRVYPRACGGTYTLLNIIAGVAGLSPRLRGNLQSKHSVS